MQKTIFWPFKKWYKQFRQELRLTFFTVARYWPTVQKNCCRILILILFKNHPFSSQFDWTTCTHTCINYNINSYLLRTIEIKTIKEGEQTSPAFVLPNDWHTKQWNKKFTSLEQQIESLIKYITPKMNVRGEIKRMANVLKMRYSRLKRLDSEWFLEMTNTPQTAVKQKTSPSLARGTRVLKAKDQVGDVSDTPSKRKEISPLKREGRMVEKYLPRIG